ncbi:hypothetical protein M011DRAFT_464148, partial [Sporormia fimetaria CBS 119925]
MLPVEYYGFLHRWCSLSSIFISSFFQPVLSVSVRFSSTRQPITRRLLHLHYLRNCASSRLFLENDLSQNMPHVPKRHTRSRKNPLISVSTLKMMRRRSISLMRSGAG